MKEKIKRLNDVLRRLRNFDGRASDSKVDELSEMLISEYSLETNTNIAFSETPYLVDLKETKNILNDLSQYSNQPRNLDNAFSIVVMHFKMDIENELARIIESVS